MRLIVLLLIVASAAGFAVQPMAAARRSVAVAAPSAVSQSVFMVRAHGNVAPFAGAHETVLCCALTPVDHCCATLCLAAQGRGDKRTKKGKMKGGKKGSFGKTRPSKAPLKLRQLKPASYLALNQQQ